MLPARRSEGEEARDGPLLACIVERANGDSSPLPAGTVGSERSEGAGPKASPAVEVAEVTRLLDPSRDGVAAAEGGRVVSGTMDVADSSGPDSCRVSRLP